VSDNVRRNANESAIRGVLEPVREGEKVVRQRVEGEGPKASKVYIGYYSVIPELLNRVGIVLEWR